MLPRIPAEVMTRMEEIRAGVASGEIAVALNK